MAQLGIKGHPTRGKEVIEILEMFSGKSNGNMNGYNDDLYYYIAKDGLIYGSGIEYEELACNYSLFTLEEFEEKFPYKVDDVVVNHKYGKGDITQMVWIDNEIVYEIHFEDCMAYCKANELCKYDAFKAGDKVIVKGFEKMGEDEIIYVFKSYDGDIKYKTKNHLDTHYFMEDSFTKVEKSNKEENMEKRLEPVYELGTGKILYYEEKVSGEKYCPIGETTLYIQEDYEFRDETNNVINAKKITLTRKKPQYPKTYIECAKILNCFSASYIDGYKNELLEKLQELLICHAAYRKIAGTEMGLGKPWKPDWREKRYIIYQNQDNIIGGCREAGFVEHHIFEFPTAEMRDAFYDNFKELINDCKELL